MSSYLSKSQKAFKPKAPARRNAAAAAQSSSSQATSVRGSVERQTQTPQPPTTTRQTPLIEVRQPSPIPPNPDQDATPAAPEQNEPEVESRQSDQQTDSLQVPPRTRATSSPSRTSTTPSQPDSVQTQTLSSPTTETPSSTSVISTGAESTVGPEVSSEKTTVATTRASTRNSQSPSLKRAAPSTESADGDQIGHGQRSPKRRRGAEARAAGGLPTPASSGTEQAQDDATETLPQEQAREAPVATPHEGQQEVEETQEENVEKTQQENTATKKKRQPRKRKRPETTTQTDQNNEDGEEDGEREPSRAKKRKRKERGPTPEENQGAEIATNTVTMSQLTRDSRMGKTSSRYLRLKEKDKLEQEKRQEQIREDFQEFMDNPEGGESRTESPATPATPAAPEPPRSRLRLEPEPERSAVRLAPQVRLVNGQIVQDEDSRMISRHDDIQARDSEDIMIEDELTRKVNQATHMKRERNNKWTAEATELFFDGLRMFGTDFQTISMMFPDRNRRQIKLKFCKEERADAEYIKQVLLHERRDPSLERFQQLSGETYRDPVELQREMDEDRRNLEEEQRKEDEAIKELQKQRDADIAAERTNTRGSSSRENRAPSEVEADESYDEADYVAPAKGSKLVAGAADKVGNARTTRGKA